jgi:signal peptidase I
MEKLEEAANKWLKPYPNAAWRENVEVLLVALAVAMGIRTFFLQPFKIPTGSMQPTLFGVTSVPDFTKIRGGSREEDRVRIQAEVNEQLRLRDAMQLPTGLERVREWFAGISYVHLVADTDGVFQGAEPPVKILIFNILQKIHFAGRTYTVWFPPDYGSPTLEQRCGIRQGQEFHRGEDVVKLRIGTGDHLFVDRMTYNFRAPGRGEIVVFETKGIDGLQQDQFYIKRLVALAGEKVQVGDDRHLVIDGHRLDASTPHFENVYSFNPKNPPQESHYSGHVNQKIVEVYSPGQYMPLFADASAVYAVSPEHLMVMGDNTMNSLDSRFWGDFPAANVIGRAHFVYWPITARFGWGCVNH